MEIERRMEILRQKPQSPPDSNLVLREADLSHVCGAAALHALQDWQRLSEAARVRTDAGDEQARAYLAELCHRRLQQRVELVRCLREGVDAELLDDKRIEVKQLQAALRNLEKKAAQPLPCAALKDVLDAPVLSPKQLLSACALGYSRAWSDRRGQPARWRDASMDMRPEVASLVKPLAAAALQHFDRASATAAELAQGSASAVDEWLASKPPIKWENQSRARELWQELDREQTLVSFFGITAVPSPLPQKGCEAYRYIFLGLNCGSEWTEQNPLGLLQGMGEWPYRDHSDISEGAHPAAAADTAGESASEPAPKRQRTETDGCDEAQGRSRGLAGARRPGTSEPRAAVYVAAAIAKAHLSEAWYQVAAACEKVAELKEEQVHPRLRRRSIAHGVATRVSWGPFLPLAGSSCVTSLVLCVTSPLRRIGRLRNGSG